MKRESDTNTKEQKLRDALFSLLQEKGVKSLEVVYNGQGDAGELERAEIDGECNSPILEDHLGSFDVVYSYTYAVSGMIPNYVTKDLTIGEAVDSVCYAILEEKFGGWEINEGSFGTFQIDVSTRNISLTHNQRIESVETSSLEDL